MLSYDTMLEHEREAFEKTGSEPEKVFMAFENEELVFSSSDINEMQDYKDCETGFVYERNFYPKDIDKSYRLMEIVEL